MDVAGHKSSGPLGCGRGRRDVVERKDSNSSRYVPLDLTDHQDDGSTRQLEEDFASYRRASSTSNIDNDEEEEEEDFEPNSSCMVFLIAKPGHKNVKLEMAVKNTEDENCAFARDWVDALSYLLLRRQRRQNSGAGAGSSAPSSHFN